MRSVVAVVAVVVATPRLAAQPARGVLDAGRMVREVMLEADTAGVAVAEERWRPQVRGNKALTALLEGTLARLRYHSEDAARQFAVAQIDSLGRAGAHATMGLASLSGQRSQYTEALALYRRAATRMAQHADSAGQVEALLGEAMTVLRTAGIVPTTQRFRDAALLLPKQDAWLQARYGCLQLQVRVRASEVIADSSWQRALAEAGSQGPRVLSDCLFARAQFLDARGAPSALFAVLDTLTELQRRAGLLPGLAATLQWRGSALIAGGSYYGARRKLRESLDVARRSESRGGEAWAMLNLSQIAARTGAAGDAGRLLTDARAILFEIGDRTGLAFADRAIADGLLLRGDLALADSAFRAIAAASDALTPSVAVTLLVVRADIARQQGRLEASRLLLDHADSLAKARNYTGNATDRAYQRGLLALGNGDAAAALSVWRTLLGVRGMVGPSRFEVLSRIAEAEASTGALDAAWRDVRTAQMTIDAWRASRSRREDQLAALADRHLDGDLDLGLATLVSRFAMAHRNAEALSMAEWRRVRSREQQALQRGVLAVDASRSVGITARPFDSLTVDPSRVPALARARLSPTHAVVSYIVGRGGEPTTAFVLTRDTLISVRLAPIDSLASRIERFSAFLQAGRLMVPLARELAVQVIDPVIAALPPGITRLVLVPDGALHRLPFAALTDEKGGALLTHYEIAVAPSVEDALGAAIGVSRRRNGTTDDRALVIGAPANMPTMPRSTDRWGALPGARAEARSVAGMLRGGALMDGGDATRDRIVQRLSEGGQLLHIATHAVADPDSYEGSGIVVQSTATHDGLFDLSDFSAQALPFDLVVLSACASGDGVLLSGQALHGLVSTALDAGARGVLATRWRVEDAAIVPYMEAFYRAQIAGNDVVTALHMVRTDAMRNGASPAVWANLEYFGDPTLRVALHERPVSRWTRWTASVRRWFRRAA
jgi:tetratricopeptide (TPR) repeat protein